MEREDARMIIKTVGMKGAWRNVLHISDRNPGSGKEYYGRSYSGEIEFARYFKGYN